MKSESVDQWGDQRRFWCTSNILSRPERYCRNQYTPPSSWQQRMYSSWYMQTTRRRMQLKDLRMVMTTLESTFLSTMESTHEHAMRLQASQPVAPPAILPPLCRIENKLYKNSTPLLTHHCLVCIWWQPWAWLLGWGWWCLRVVCFFVMCEYFLLKDDVSYSISYTWKVLRATDMYEFLTYKKRTKREKRTDVPRASQMCHHVDTLCVRTLDAIQYRILHVFPH